jgi:hypothetical protein
VHFTEYEFAYIIGYYCEWQECTIGETEEMLEMRKEIRIAHGKQP